VNNVLNFREIKSHIWEAKGAPHYEASLA